MPWLCCITILLNILGAFANDLLACYSPVRLSYLVKEPSGGVVANLNPILFLHAVDCSKEYWFGIPQSVADRTGRKVYVLDARNHGDSEWSYCFNFDVNAQDVVRFMDDLAIPRAILVGHSMGGATAIKVALVHPARVEKLIVEDMRVASLSGEGASVISRYILLLEEAAESVPHFYDLEAANRYVLDYVNADPLTAITYGVSTIPVNTTRYIPLKRATTGGYTMKTNIEVVIDTFRTPETVMLNNTGVYRSPAFFIYGTESPLAVFQDALNILSHFPNVLFFPVAGSNHEIHNNLPDQFTEYILQFIQSNLYG